MEIYKLDDFKRVEFNNAVNDCRKKADYILDVYREVVAAFEKREDDATRGKGIIMALSKAKRAGVITEIEEKRMKEDWEAIPNSSDLGDLQENMEKRIFNILFNCALKAINKLAME